MQSIFLEKEKKESCGLFGIFGHPQASFYTYLGLYALQHRGEESCGIVSFCQDKFYIHRDMGLVTEVFNKDILNSLPGDIAIGHTRYSTTGSSHIRNAQPLFLEDLEGGLCIAHNGNIVNSLELRKSLESKGVMFTGTSDSEVILQLILKEKSKDLIERIIKTLQKLKGAFSLIFMIPDKIIGVRDPWGFRPLCIGRKRDAFCISSESCALDLIEASFLREVEPGEVVIIDKKGLKSFFPFSKPLHKSMCIFEHIYFSRPDSIIFGENVHLVREKLGRKLAEEHPVDADLVIPVPDSGSSAALGFSLATGIPLEMGIIRNHYVGRTFIQPHQEIRDLGVRVKFNILKEVIKGKRIVIVDDSIVRGTTSKKRIRQFRELGAKEVHLRISCPPHRFPCFYGIDFPSQEELIAHNRSVEEICDFLGADSLGYLSLEGMLSCVKNDPQDYCVACFTGKYPVKFKKADKFILEK